MIRLATLALLVAILSASVRESRTSGPADAISNPSGAAGPAGAVLPAAWFRFRRQDTTAAPIPGTFPAVNVNAPEQEPRPRATRRPAPGGIHRDNGGRAGGARIR